MIESVNDNTELYSEEVQEIINRPPSWIVMWGIGIMFMVFVVFVVLTWFIKYPDVLHANVVITTSPTPVTLITRNQGQLRILKKDKENVKAGDLLAVVKSNVNVNDLLDLESTLASNGHELLELNYQLGDLQHYLNELVRSQQELESFTKNDLINRQLSKLEKQAAYQLMLNANSQQQLMLLQKELNLAREKFGADSLLFQESVLARMDFNSSQASFLQHQRSVRAAEAAVIGNQREIVLLEKQIIELAVQQATLKAQLNLAVDSNLAELISGIKKWKESFLMISPADGQLSYLEFLQTDQFVESGKKLFSIVPATGMVFGMAELPTNSSGKVKEGQDVNIRLENYPFEQFGMLRGKVESVSLIPNQGKYLLRISLPAGMISSYGQPIPFHQQLQGDVEVITEDLRLLERLFYRLIKLTRQ